jgi:pimeloyl-ACP methyl ester carboxylesterase
MDSVRVANLEIAYRRAGAGPPLVLLHGAACDGRTWGPQLSGLTDRFDVIAWDEPGAGRSSDPPAGLDLPGYAAYLASFIGELGIGRVHLAGLSWGGVLAQELCLRHPELVGSLILADTNAGWKGSLSAAECEQRLELALAQAGVPPDAYAPAVPRLFGPTAAPELISRVAAIVAETRPASLRQTAIAMAACDLRERQAAIHVPCLLLWGEADARSPLCVAADLLERIPGATLVVLPDAGHMSNLEQPERFNAELRRFCGSVAL